MISISNLDVAKDVKSPITVKTPVEFPGDKVPLFIKLDALVISTLAIPLTIPSTYLKICFW